MSLKLQNDQAQLQFWSLVNLHALFPEWEINIDADNGTVALECDDLPQRLGSLRTGQSIMSLNGWKALVYSVAVGLRLWAVTIAGCVYVAG
uniref:Uncharacterized protein n=1 Tax=Serratia marcescens TaxID=615 RepID=A0A1C3H9J2_SERMA|nr:Uncharacterised protein [Serratia marcescens]